MLHWGVFCALVFLVLVVIDTGCCSSCVGLVGVGWFPGFCVDFDVGGR